MNEIEKLTPVHWGVYRAIEESTANGAAITQKELCDKVGIKYQDHATNSKIQAKGDHCRKLWTIIDDINRSMEVDKIVVVDGFTYRLGTEEDSDKYAKKLWRKCKPLLQRINAVNAKMARNGQGKILNNQGNPIKPGNEEFHETYVR